MPNGDGVCSYCGALGTHKGIEHTADCPYARKTEETMSGVFVDKNVLACFEYVALNIAEQDAEDTKCWCGLSMEGPSQHGLHTGWCNTLRKWFDITAEDGNVT